jgi:hypothetical protein
MLDQSLHITGPNLPTSSNLQTRFTHCTAPNTTVKINVRAVVVKCILLKSIPISVPQISLLEPFHDLISTTNPPCMYSNFRCAGRLLLTSKYLIASKKVKCSKGFMGSLRENTHIHRYLADLLDYWHRQLRNDHQVQPLTLSTLSGWHFLLIL